MSQAGRDTLKEAARALTAAADDPTPAKLAHAVTLARRAARALAYAGFRE